ncbi:GINS complex subunit 4 [Exophiala viscosa]|uniref:GINS complex subunit 4 n=1 Tax=Exophiala viscosa TaxID=2486360 RepID=UPI00219FFC5F|nr:GINS complex subunit 4 [Exophiala viscosa]
MDLDISDILASVSRPFDRTSQSQSHIAYSDTDNFTDHQLLTRAWTSERCAPDLLPYPKELMARVMSRVQAQISRIEDLASGGGETGKGQNTNLILSILQTDLSRTQFLVRSFLRQRLAKITKFAGWYLSRDVESDTKTTYLSEAEVSFLRGHQALLSEFYDASFLTAVPVGLRRLDDASGGVNMVEGPDGGQAVVVRCLGEMWTNERDADGERDEAEGANVELRMGRGEVWVVRWRDCRRGVERGELEVL